MPGQWLSSAMGPPRSLGPKMQVWGLGFRVWSSKGLGIGFYQGFTRLPASLRGFRVWGFGVWSLGFGVWSLGPRVCSLGGIAVGPPAASVKLNPT